ncbi:MAG: hypothetical protein IJ272_07935 [Clostridia bacterium]|nr:hypothetical protein [Clostridia bacterium]
MKTRKLFTALLAVMLVLSMCFANVSVSAASVESVSQPEDVSEPVYVTLTGEYVEEDGKTYVEFTIPETYDTRAMTDYHEYMETIYNYERNGGAFTCQGNRITVTAVGENVGASVKIQLEYKGLLNQFYDVSGASKTIVCDGTTKNLFNSITVTPGETYRFTYLQTNMSNVYPKVTLVAVMYTA